MKDFPTGPRLPARMLFRLLLWKSFQPLLGFGMFVGYFLWREPGARPLPTFSFEFAALMLYAAITALLIYYGLFGQGSFGHIVWFEITDRLHDRRIRREVKRLLDE